MGFVRGYTNNVDNWPAKIAHKKLMGEMPAASDLPLHAVYPSPWCIGVNSFDYAMMICDWEVKHRNYKDISGTFRNPQPWYFLNIIASTNGRRLQ